jgi:hypothetical protein
MRGTYAVLNDFESPPHEMIRSSFTSDFVYEDRRRGALFPIMDAELVKEAFASFWDTGAGRPRFTVPEILAVRGERLVAARLVVDYDIGFVLEAIQMLQLDATVTRVQRAFDFDVDDLDVGEAAVLALGARKTDVQPEPEAFRVFLDPAGHPFCLVLAD